VTLRGWRDDEQDEADGNNAPFLERLALPD